MNRFNPTELTQSAPARLFALGPAATKVVIVAFFAVLLLLYLAQSTQGATRQYEIRNLEDDLTTLKQDREQLELESIRLQSLKEIAPAPAEEPKPEEAAPLAPATHINAVPSSSTVVVSR